MSNFSSLKAAIQQYIKTNGNEEITGAVLQDILLSMVSVLGDTAINDLETALQTETTNRTNADGTLQTNINNEATARGNADTALGNRITAVEGSITTINTMLGEGYLYAGLATTSTNPGTPTGKVFYIATAAGTYTNFSSIELTYGINILKYNGSAWSSEQVLAIDDEPTIGSGNLVKSGGIVKYQFSKYNKTKYDLIGTSKYINSPTDVSSYGIHANYIVIRYDLDNLRESIFRVHTFIGSVAYMMFTDSNNTVLMSYKMIGTLSGTTRYFNLDTIFCAPENAKYLYVSVDKVECPDYGIEVVSNTIPVKEIIYNAYVNSAGVVTSYSIAQHGYDVIKYNISNLKDYSKIILSGLSMPSAAYVTFLNSSNTLMRTAKVNPYENFSFLKRQGEYYMLITTTFKTTTDSLHWTSYMPSALDKYPDILKMKWQCIGDSITWYNDNMPTSLPNKSNMMFAGYQDIVRQEIGFSDFSNIGVSGSYSTEWANTYKNNIVPAGLYTILLGINDFGNNHSVPIGDFETDYLGNTGAGTFYGNMRVIIDTCKNQADSSYIILFTPLRGQGLPWLPSSSNLPNNDGQFLYEFADAILTIAKHESMPVVDLFYKSGITSTNIMYYTIDGVHPNIYGFEIIGNMLLDCLSSHKFKKY